MAKLGNLTVKLNLDTTAKVLQGRRDKLEAAVAKLLAEFEDETLLTIEAVYLKRKPSVIGQGKADITGASIEVML